ncbi:transmembrane protease serine 12 [Tachyglossus aculeatus]|uniref:transmembrane protease serine 12 n=1 Tax=Tachyglossus aculeatus TaxID=9261 RepID=UPI0018F2A8B4|nr:transmembrane protease serine 12 [Tachyglossus aculeatus]
MGPKLALLSAALCLAGAAVNPEELWSMQDDCGKSLLQDVVLGSRIVGGREAQTGAWPWIVSLQMIYSTSQLHICGGTIVKEKWIVTAAHCLKSLNNPAYWQAVVGIHNLRRPHRFTQKIRVKKIIIHPNFNMDLFINDIAIFQLKKAIRFNAYVRPICLPFLNILINLNESTRCFIGGWGGTTEKGKHSVFLQEAEVKLVSRDICNSHKGYSGLVPNSSFCASGDGGIDTCRGDSGGPFMCYIPEAEKFFLMGITSFGIGCGQKNYPGVYVKVGLYKNWVTQEILKAINSTGSGSTGLLRNLLTLGWAISLVLSGRGA